MLIDIIDFIILQTAGITMIKQGHVNKGALE